MTDTLVLKNTKFTKGLMMPKKGTYLELDQDEMEYVDGGWIATACEIASLACTITLFLDRNNIIKLPFWSKVALKIGAWLFGIVGCLSAIGSTIKTLGKIAAKKLVGEVALKSALKKTLVEDLLSSLFGLSSAVFSDF